MSGFVRQRRCCEHVDLLNGATFSGGDLSIWHVSTVYGDALGYSVVIVIYQPEDTLDGSHRSS